MALRGCLLTAALLSVSLAVRTEYSLEASSGLTANAENNARDVQQDVKIKEHKADESEDDEVFDESQCPGVRATCLPSVGHDCRKCSLSQQFRPRACKRCPCVCGYLPSRHFELK
eukprot:TRINITY_DN3441_c1_g1_i1.p1 TRINITY_DN3441_c1_g1~~TRINITY_DN3441_c1_g1_i1.p1  ORF type:complete len:115 (+),score=17.71 TRINITY_DN3441_c1_g1_i1:105-449(+)